IVVPSRGGSSAPGEIAVSLPWSIWMFWSNLGAAPVPSMISTCSRITLAVVTRRYLRTPGPRASRRWAPATLEVVIAAMQTVSKGCSSQLLVTQQPFAKYMTAHYHGVSAVPPAMRGAVVSLQQVVGRAVPPWVYSRGAPPLHDRAGCVRAPGLAGDRRTRVRVACQRHAV